MASKIREYMKRKDDINKKLKENTRKPNEIVLSEESKKINEKPNEDSQKEENIFVLDDNVDDITRKTEKNISLYKKFYMIPEISLTK